MFSKSSKNAINIIARIAISAVVVGSLALFIVLSGFSGLRDFSLQFTNIFDSDLKIYPAKGKTITFSEDTESKIKIVPGIESYSKIIEEKVFLNYRGKNHIAHIKGVDENFGNIVPLDSILFINKWFVPNQNEVVIGLDSLKAVNQF